MFVEAERYPFAAKVAGPRSGPAWRGSQDSRRRSGEPGERYLRKADPWPPEQRGEILRPVKTRTSYALANSEKTTKVPGIAFAEGGQVATWASGCWVRRSRARNDTRCTVMRRGALTRARSTKAAKIFFLNSCNDKNVVEMIKDGML